MINRDITRKDNLIFHSVSESDTDNSDRRTENDINAFLEIIIK